MKKLDYSIGENNETLPTRSFVSAIAHISPVNRAIKAVHRDSVSFDPKVVGNQVINNCVNLLEAIVMSYLEEFYLDHKSFVTVDHRILTAGNTPQDKVSILQLAGPQDDPVLAEEIGHAIRYISGNILQTQIEIPFEDVSLDLSDEKTAFLDARVSDIREHFSGKEIKQPFGVEILGENPQTFSFKGRFDVVEFIPPDPEPCAGFGKVDGIRDSENAVFLTLFDEEGNACEASRAFLVTCTDLIEMALEARRNHQWVRYQGLEIFEKSTKKSDFLLEDLDIVDGGNPFEDS